MGLSALHVDPCRVVLFNMTHELRTLPVGASVWEEDLHRLLTSHVVSERALLDEYVETSRTTGSQALAYIVDLLIEDERRHHRIWLDLADSLCVDARLLDEPTAIPAVDFNPSNADRVLAITKRLLASEREDIRQLRKVHKALESVHDTTLWGLLVELMEHDTKKHIAILRFANHRARAAKRR